jgi:FkbM family methyltransferase
MIRVATFRKFNRVKGAIARRGVAAIPGVNAVVSAVQHRYFREYYDQSAETLELQLDGISLIIPRRFIHHYISHDYEPVSTSAFLGALRPGMTVVDAGAHIGYYAVLAAKGVGESGVVHAIEPCRETAAVLQRNVDINHLRNVRVHVNAAGGTRAARTFQITGSSDSHGFYAHPNTPTLRTTTVEQIPLDEIVTGPVGVVMIDVEGAELEVLDGMKNIMANSPRLIMFAEWFPAGMKSAGREPLELPEYLSRVGFSSIDVIDESAGRIMSVGEVSARLATLPRHWYANIVARRG